MNVQKERIILKIILKSYVALWNMTCNKVNNIYIIIIKKLLWEGVKELTHSQCPRLKRRDYWVPDPPLTSSWPCKNPDPIISTLTGFICWLDCLPLICGSGVWCLQVPASYKRHILMGLPLLCLIAVSPPPPPPSWPPPPHPPSASALALG